MAEIDNTTEEIAYFNRRNERRGNRQIQNFSTRGEPRRARFSRRARSTSRRRFPPPSNVIGEGDSKKACYGCGSYDHLRASCPKENTRGRIRGRGSRRGGFRQRNRISEVNETQNGDEEYESYSEEEDEESDSIDDEVYAISEGIDRVRL